MKRVVAVVMLVMLPLIVGAETIRWTPSTTWKDGTAVSAADQAKFTFYLRLTKQGSTVETYFGEAKNGATSWTDNVIAKANQYGSAVSGWQMLVPGDTVLITMTSAFLGNDNVWRESSRSSALTYTIPKPVPVTPGCNPPTNLTITQ